MIRLFYLLSTLAMLTLTGMKNCPLKKNKNLLFLKYVVKIKKKLDAGFLISFSFKCRFPVQLDRLSLASVSQAEFSCSMHETEAKLLSWHGTRRSIWLVREPSSKQVPFWKYSALVYFFQNRGGKKQHKFSVPILVSFREKKPNQTNQKMK